MSTHASMGYTVHPIITPVVHREFCATGNVLPQCPQPARTLIGIEFQLSRAFLGMLDLGGLKPPGPLLVCEGVCAPSSQFVAH